MSLHFGDAQKIGVMKLEILRDCPTSCWSNIHGKNPKENLQTNMTFPYTMNHLDDKYTYIYTYIYIYAYVYIYIYIRYLYVYTHTIHICVVP